MLRMFLGFLLTVSVSTPVVPFLRPVIAGETVVPRPRNPHNVPEIDLFAGGSALMIAVLVALLIWEWHRRTLGGNGLDEQCLGSDHRH